MAKNAKTSLKPRPTTYHGPKWLAGWDPWNGTTCHHQSVILKPMGSSSVQKKKTEFPILRLKFNV
jgi:hypothetical protein